MRVFGIGLIIGILMLAASGQNASAAQATVTPPTPTTVPILYCPPACDALTAKTTQRGALNIIVALKMPFYSETSLNVAELQSQRAAIAKAQAALFGQLSAYAGKVPGSGGYQAMIVPTRTPYLVLQLDKVTLPLLINNPLVNMLQEDIPATSNYGFTLGLSLATAETEAPALVTPNATPYIFAVANCPPTCETLRTAIRKSGSQSVIVTLNIGQPYYLETSLSPASQQVQRVAIRRALIALMPLLTGTQATFTMMYYNQPSVVMNIDEHALLTLATMPDVVLSIVMNNQSSPT